LPILLEVDLHQIKAVTFDAAGTLVEPWPSVGAVYARVAEECGIGPVSAEELNQRFARAWKGKRDFDYSRTAWRRIVSKTFSGLAPVKPAFFDHVYDEFAHSRCWRVYDDVGLALERCRARGLKVGVISNWDERLRPLLGQMGLAPYFDTVLVSREVGHHKPERQIFERAVESLQVPPAHILHVGDSVAEDLEGAAKAGFHSVLLDRSGANVKAMASLDGLLSD
jgi:putative hydrolase of the HAD superfamily